MTDWKHGPPKTPDWLECLGWTALTTSVFLVLFGTWTWAQDVMSAVNATQGRDIAVLQTQMMDIGRRVTTIEDRLFSILLTSVGAVLASLTASLFSIRTLHRLKNERQP